jgi:hypothetical protein
MATQKTITDFKTALVGGGARPNLFEVINLPTFLIHQQELFLKNL